MNIDELSKRMNKEIINLNTYSALLFITKGEDYFNTIIEVLKKKIVNETAGIYVSLNRPYNSLLDIFKKEGIDSEKIIFIDCVTKMVSNEAVNNVENVIFINTPQDLNKLSVAISKTVNAVEYTNKILFVDALRTLLIYNSQKTVSKFIYSLINRMRLLNINIIMLSIENELDSDIMNLLTQSVDKVINLSVEEK